MARMLLKCRRTGYGIGHGQSVLLRRLRRRTLAASNTHPRHIEDHRPKWVRLSDQYVDTPQFGCGAPEGYLRQLNETALHQVGSADPAVQGLADLWRLDVVQDVTARADHIAVMTSAPSHGLYTDVGCLRDAGNEVRA